MARSIKIGDEITTSILNSVETTITANLLTSGQKPNFAACKAVATRLSNYVAACEAHYRELEAQAQPKVVEGLTPEESAVLQALLAKVSKPEASKPKAEAPAKPAPKKSTTSKKAKPSKSAKPKKSVGQRLAAKAGQGRKSKNTVLEAQQQLSFVSDLGNCPF